jgi:hypothetical protein
MPAELATARLVVSETTLKTLKPAPFVARVDHRVDQVFLTAAGELVPVETKTRARRESYLYDALELSVQSLVLAFHARKFRGRPAAHGYVRIVTADREPAYLKVALFPADDLVKLRTRRLALLAGRTQPLPAYDARVCRNCTQRPRCPNPRTVDEPNRSRRAIA